MDEISVTLFRCNSCLTRKSQVVRYDIMIRDKGKNANFQGEDSLQMTPEKRAELKKKQIEEEFLRYKLVRRAAAQREAAKDVHQLSFFFIPKFKFERNYFFQGQQRRM